MKSEVTQEEVFEAVERKNREGSNPTAGDIADELGAPPPEVLNVLGGLRDVDKVRKSEPENGDPIWFVRGQSKDSEEDDHGN
ncbi:hypothetical protein [Halococcus salifodinae]|uniref:hypothetical protein n=1 Tax=Halococcus salifodinae TaxID=36738 RepID=UPI0012683BE5|nr:hypothetical protein [Halococcus salifodinae]